MASLGGPIAIGWIFGSSVWHIDSWETLEDSDYKWCTTLRVYCGNNTSFVNLAKSRMGFSLIEKQFRTVKVWKHCLRQKEKQSAWQGSDPSASVTQWHTVSCSNNSYHTTPLRMMKIVYFYTLILHIVYRIWSDLTVIFSPTITCASHTEWSDHCPSWQPDYNKTCWISSSLSSLHACRGCSYDWNCTQYFCQHNHIHVTIFKPGVQVIRNISVAIVITSVLICDLWARCSASLIHRWCNEVRSTCLRVANVTGALCHGTVGKLDYGGLSSRSTWHAVFK